MTNPAGADRRRDLDRFYRLLDHLSSRLGRPRCLRECSGADGWPERGVYFFFEEGELREGVCPGGGNHRGSIFRLHLGTAFLNRGYYPPPSLPTPGHRARAGSAAEDGRGPAPARNPRENNGCSSRRPGSRS